MNQISTQICSCVNGWSGNRLTDGQTDATDCSPLSTNAVGSETKGAKYMAAWPRLITVREHDNDDTAYQQHLQSAVSCRATPAFDARSVGRRAFSVLTRRPGKRYQTTCETSHVDLFSARPQHFLSLAYAAH